MNINDLLTNWFPHFIFNWPSFSSKAAVYRNKKRQKSSLAQMTPKHCHFSVGPANAYFHCGVNKQMMHLSKRRLVLLTERWDVQVSVSVEPLKRNVTASANETDKPEWPLTAYLCLKWIFNPWNVSFFWAVLIVSREPAFQFQANMFWFLKILDDMRTTAGFAQCQQLPAKQKCRKTQDLWLGCFER